MSKIEYIVVLITTGSYEEADKIARALLDRREAACVNIVPSINSIFWWQGKLESTPESLLLVKARAELFPEIVKTVKQIHSYEVPEIIALPIVDGNLEYLTWLGKETAMQKTIKIKAGDLELKGYLNDTETASIVMKSLPVSSTVNLWGDEIYFTTSIKAESENPQEVVNIGDIAYWPPGKALCLFFGRTPVSKGDEIRPASAVNIIGRFEGDFKLLKKVKEGQEITIGRA